jgi:hypothetical protein
MTDICALIADDAFAASFQSLGQYRTALLAALAQPEPQGPTDEELLMLMPETMRDEFSYAARVCSDATGGQVKPGIFRVALNTAALEYARAVLGAADAKPTSLEAAPQPQDKLDRLIEMDRTATDHFPDITKMVTTGSLVDREAER